MIRSVYDVVLEASPHEFSNLSPHRPGIGKGKSSQRQTPRIQAEWQDCHSENSQRWAGFLNSIAVKAERYHIDFVAKFYQSSSQVLGKGGYSPIIGQRGILPADETYSQLPKFHTKT
jgi:hypothetical protein